MYAHICYINYVGCVTPDAPWPTPSALPRRRRPRRRRRRLCSLQDATRGCFAGIIYIYIYIYIRTHFFFFFFFIFILIIISSSRSTATATARDVLRSRSAKAVGSKSCSPKGEGCKRRENLGAVTNRHRLSGYLAQQVPSIFLASTFGSCLNCAGLKCMFAWRTRYSLS